MAKPARGMIVMGTEGDDVLLAGGEGNDSIYGYGGNDRLEGYSGNDTLYAHGGDDTILGGDGVDTIAGGEGDDIIDAGAGADQILTGPGNDMITGGGGADRFFFGQSFETATNVHTITDFSRAEGDYIDLKSMDADGDSSNDPRKGNTDFTVVTTPTGTAGEAWMVPIFDPVTGQQTGTSIFLNTDSDLDADIQINVLGAVNLTWGIDVFG